MHPEVAATAGGETPEGGVEVEGDFTSLPFSEEYRVFVTRELATTDSLDFDLLLPFDPAEADLLLSGTCPSDYSGTEIPFTTVIEDGILEGRALFVLTLRAGNWSVSNLVPLD